MKSLRGAIGFPDLPDALRLLRASSSSGRLRLENEGIARDLYFKEGRLVAADSSARADSLEWLLFTAGVLSQERHGQVRARIDAGHGRGKALVESGGLSPSLLCEWTERRARFLASDAMSWRSGTYEFEQGGGPPQGCITVRLDPLELLLTALREKPPAAAPEAEAVLAPSPDMGLVASHLLPHEAYVLSLADGRRKAAEICELSEIGEAATLTALALLAASGALAAAGAPAPAAPSVPPLDLPAGETPAELRAAIRAYNELCGFVCAYMVKEVGPIAEQLLEKHLREVREIHAVVFNRVTPGRDGALPEETLLRNVNVVRDQNRRDLLVAGLHDYLMAMVVAVRRILGPDHEGSVLRRLKEARCAKI